MGTVKRDQPRLGMNTQQQGGDIAKTPPAPSDWHEWCRSSGRAEAGRCPSHRVSGAKRDLGISKQVIDSGSTDLVCTCQVAVLLRGVEG